MSEPMENNQTNNTNTNQNPGQTPETHAEQTFSQAEVESIIQKRLAKAMKGMPEKEELSAFRAWKESQQTEKERWENLKKERDESKNALEAAKAELEQARRERHLLSLGVPAEDVDYYAFKIGKMVDDSTTFEKAAEKLLSGKPNAGTMRVDFSAPAGSGRQEMTPAQEMNNIIRGARR